MNKEEIISSGMLESYITGDLSPDERAEVEKFISEDTQVRQEYFFIQKTLEVLAIRQGSMPTPAVKDYILKDLQIEKKVVDISRHRNWRYIAAASIILALFSSFLALNFWQKWKSTNEELVALASRNQELAENYNQVNQNLEDIRNDLSVLIDPSYLRVVLKGTENAPQASAVIYWNPDQNKIFLNSATLTNLSENQQYQLWAIVDGKPVDAGVFDPVQGKFQTMKSVDGAEAFAVTIEKKGGSPSPTLSTMQVFGKTS